MARNLDDLFSYRQPDNAQSDKSGSHGRAVAAAAKALAQVIVDSAPDGPAIDESLDFLREAVTVAQEAIADVQRVPVPAPQSPVEN